MTTPPPPDAKHAPPPPPPPAAGPLLFVIVDHCNPPVADPLERIAAAVEKQANQHAGAPQPRGWGLDVMVGVVKAGEPLPPGAVVVGLFEDPDQPGALGYHACDPRGRPYIKVFPKLDAEAGAQLSVTISHEVLEAAADPNCNLCAQSPTDGRVWALESCDAVEDDTYEIDGIAVSDFVLPAYFSPPQDRAGVRYDWLGLVRAPFEIRPGGYGQFLGDGGWQQVEKQDRRPTFRLAHPTRGYARRRGG